MATAIRKTDPTTAAMAAAFNDLKTQLVAQIRAVQTDLASASGAGSAAPSLGFHNDRSEQTITAANATDLPTALVLCNQLTGVYKFHMADKLAHKVVGVDLTSYAMVSTLAAAETQANDIKAKYNVHRASTTFHYVADSTDNTTSADASDLASLETLLNELKSDFNAHMASGPVAKSLRVTAA